MLAWARRLPPPGWWGRVAVLAALNIGLFQAALFVGAFLVLAALWLAARGTNTGPPFDEMIGSGSRKVRAGLHPHFAPADAAHRQQHAHHGPG